MKVIVFGATGPTGKLICQKALEAGHEVTAFARTPSKVSLNHHLLNVAEGNIYDADSVARAMEGMEAVICGVGVPFTRKPVTIYSTAARHIVSAMSEQGIRRFICISSGGTKPGWNRRNPLFFEFVLKRLFHTLYDDMAAMEKIVMATDTDWTILRPPRLLDKPASREVRLGVDEYSLVKGGEVSREGLAEVAVKALTDREMIRHAVAVAE